MQTENCNCNPLHFIVEAQNFSKFFATLHTLGTLGKRWKIKRPKENLFEHQNVVFCIETNVLIFSIELNVFFLTWNLMIRCCGFPKLHFSQSDSMFNYHLCIFWCRKNLDLLLRSSLLLLLGYIFSSNKNNLWNIKRNILEKTWTLFSGF